MINLRHSFVDLAAAATSQLSTNRRQHPIPQTPGCISTEKPWGSYVMFGIHPSSDQVAMKSAELTDGMVGGTANLPPTSPTCASHLRSPSHRQRQCHCNGGIAECLVSTQEARRSTSPPPQWWVKDVSQDMCL